LVLKSLRKLLEKEKYFVETAKSAKEALEKIKNSNFNLIICDIRMPEMNGIEFTEELKKEKDIPIIFITGYFSEDGPIKAEKLGVKDYILKPFDIDKLLEAIKRII
jgi:CheY-like chemotaxis protein